jgi:hypothetical protein
MVFPKYNARRISPVHCRVAGSGIITLLARNKKAAPIAEGIPASLSDIKIAWQIDQIAGILSAHTQSRTRKAHLEIACQ